MRTFLTRRLLLSAAVVAALWMATAGARDALLQIPSGIAQLSSLLPELVPTSLTAYQAGGFGIAATVVGGIVLGVVFSVIVALVRHQGARFVSSWFALVVAAALIGLGFDLGAGWSWIVSYGPRGLLSSGFGVAAAAGALWGLAVGWIPALIARVSVAEPAPARPPLWPVPVAAAAVAAVVIAGVVTDAGRNAAIEALTLIFLLVCVEPLAPVEHII